MNTISFSYQYRVSCFPTGPHPNWSSIMFHILYCVTLFVVCITLFSGKSLLLYIDYNMDIFGNKVTYLRWGSVRGYLNASVRGYLREWISTEGGVLCGTALDTCGTVLENT